MHACLQTSCWVVQFTLHAPELPALAAWVTGPTLTQAFWQFITCVSQLTRQAVLVCDEISGVGATGMGRTCWASRIRSPPNAAEPASIISTIAKCRTHLM